MFTRTFKIAYTKQLIFKALQDSLSSSFFDFLFFLVVSRIRTLDLAYIMCYPSSIIKTNFYIEHLMNNE